MTSFPFRPDYSVPDVPCEGGACTPETPRCQPCIDGRDMFEADVASTFATWATLSDFAREAWRREAADA